MASEKLFQTTVTLFNGESFQLWAEGGTVKQSGLPDRLDVLAHFPGPDAVIAAGAYINGMLEMHRISLSITTKPV